MSKSLDFNALKKRHLTITLRDKEKTTLMLTMPTKRDMERLISMSENLQAMKDTSDVDLDIMDDLYIICAELMSRNKADIEVMPEQLEKCMDFEDIMLFFTTYMNFINDITSVKN